MAKLGKEEIAYVSGGVNLVLTMTFSSVRSKNRTRTRGIKVATHPRAAWFSNTTQTCH